MTTAPPNFEIMKDQMRAPWNLGNFGALAKMLGAREAENFVARLQIEPGAQVLDLACGAGAATLPLARRGAIATGLDMIPRVLEEARASAAQKGLQIRFDEGFVEELPYPNVSFDTVLSMFGVMFSPLPEVVVSEMARVLKPGGRLVLANWTQSGFSGQMSQVPSRHLPTRPGMISPMMWGEEATVCDRLKRDFTSITTSLVAFDWELPMSASDSSEFFLKSSGPLQMLLSRLDKKAQAALSRDLEDLWVEKNLAFEQNRTLVHNEYLQVVAMRR